MKAERALVIFKSQPAIDGCALTVSEQERFQELEGKMERIALRIREIAERVSDSHNSVCDVSLQQLREEQGESKENMKVSTEKNRKTRAFKNN